MAIGCRQQLPITQLGRDDAPVFFRRRVPSTFMFEIGLGEFGGGTRVRGQSALDFGIPPIGSVHLFARLLQTEWEQQQ